jgi:hypothetical protein
MGGWGSSHKVYGHGLKKMTIFSKQFEQAELPMQNFSKLLGVLKIRHQNLINAIDQKK